ncbi:MAG: hypothetical protein ACLFNL_09205 [Bacteroidales bacterium]
MGQLRIKPIKIFFVFFCLLTIIGIIAYIFPENGIKLNNNITLYFPGLEEIIEQEEGQYKDITEIVEKHTPNDTLLTFFPDTIAPDIKTLQNDSSLQHDTDTGIVKALPKKQTPKTQRQISDSTRIQYPQGDRSVLYPFFEQLEKIKQNDRLIRILHYGDSQIEGDRISSYIRNQLQERFGGSGIGLIPVVLPFQTEMPLEINASKNWKRYTLKNKENFQHNRFGILMSFTRFSPHYSNHHGEVYEASINLKPSPIAYNKISQYTRCKIFYGYNRKPFIIQLEKDDKVVDAEMIPATSKPEEFVWSVPPGVNQIKLSFKGEHSPDIYGIALDGEKGIALDNIPLRGSIGNEFSKADTVFYKKMLEKLNTKLILLQFGTNLVPSSHNDFKFYEDQLYNQLSTLKSLDENLSIIVIGVSDMAEKTGNRYESYPTIEKIRDAQKNAAFRAECAFWDTFQAMGGKNSMPSWVFADPPLARKDFTHFTYKGSVVIAKMFYKALMNDFLRYQQRNKQENDNIYSDTISTRE